MSATRNQMIFVVAGLALFAAFWFMVLGPKRDKAAELETQIAQLEQSVSEQRDRIEFGEDAREQFPRNYQRVVVLGKAVPENSDTASLLVQLNRIATDAGADFRGIVLGSEGATAAPAPATGAAPPVTSQPTTTDVPGEGSEPATAAPPTEAAASTLAIGASVGPAGLAVLPYKLRFQGDFFEIASFMDRLDRLVSSNKGRLVVDGRLTTVDGFSLTADQAKGFPLLNASVSVTTYLTPTGQGVTGGASPQGPATSVSGADPQLTASAGGTE